MVLHERHAHEQKPQSGQRVQDIAPRTLLEKRHQHHADERDDRGVGVDVERDELTGDGCTDVRAHDDADGVLKRHQPRVDKADGHDRNRVRALDDTRDHRTDKKPQKPVFRQLFENRLELCARQPLDAVSHDLDAEQEDRDAADDPKQIGKRDVCKRCIFQKHSNPSSLTFSCLYRNRNAVRLQPDSVNYLRKMRVKKDPSSDRSVHCNQDSVFSASISMTFRNCVSYSSR